MSSKPPDPVRRARRVRFGTFVAHVALLGATAVMLALAFPHPGWGWVAHVALVPAVVAALRSKSVWRLVWVAYLVSVAWWLWQLRWLEPITRGGYAGLCAYMGVYLPVGLVLVRWFDRRYAAPALLSLPAVWVSLELVRGWALAGGFGWFALSHSQAGYEPWHGVSRIIQVADLFGEHAVSFLVAMTNGALVDTLTRPWIVRGQVVRLGKRLTPGLGLAVWAGVMLGAWVYGGYRIDQQGDAVSGSLAVGVVQTSVPQDNKDRATAEQEAADWTRLVELTRYASTLEPAPGLIVWPETMVPASLNPSAVQHYTNTSMGTRGRERYHHQIGALAYELGVHLAVGAPASFDWRTVSGPAGTSGMRYVFEAPNRRYNSVFMYGPDGGQWGEWYDKIHRVPFGEYIPWVERWPDVKKRVMKYFSPYDHDYTLQAGEKWLVFEVPRGGVGGERCRVAPSICFEDAVPRVARRMVYGEDGVKRADVLVNLTNDGWYAGAPEGPQHVQVAALRCIENRVPMVRSVNTGISGMIDSVGRVGPVVTMNGRSQLVEGAVSATVSFDGRTSLFGRFGHLPALVLAGLTGLLVVVGRWMGVELDGQANVVAASDQARRVL